MGTYSWVTSIELSIRTLGAYFGMCRNTHRNRKNGEIVGMIRIDYQHINGTSDNIPRRKVILRAADQDAWGGLKNATGKGMFNKGSIQQDEGFKAWGLDFAWKMACESGGF